MRNNKVLIGPSSFAETDRTPLERLLAGGYQVIPNPFKRKLTKKELITLLDEHVVGIIAGLEPLDREVLEKSRLKVISRCGSGTSNIDFEAAQELGTRVFSTPDGPTTAVAELTLASLLCLLRGVHLSDRSMHQKKWDRRLGRQLSGMKVVVIGFGRIGKKVGRLLRAFGAEVMAVDPAYHDGEEGVKKADLSEAVKSTDIITLHSSGNRTILGKPEFDLMKKGVYLLNASRGEQIDEAALQEALDSGKIAGAWLDTFSREPYDGPLCDYEQVLMTSHIGSYTAECRRAMEMEAVENLLRALHE